MLFRSGGGWAAVDADDERIFLCGVPAVWTPAGGIEEPALDVQAFVGVVDGFGLAPGGLEGVVEVGDLLEVVDGAGPDFGSVIEGLADEGNVGSVGGGEAHHIRAGNDGLGQSEVDGGNVLAGV